MKTSLWWTLIIILLVVIGVMAWFLFMTSASPGTATGAATGTATGTATASTGTPTTTAPLSASVLVTSPTANATVGKVFIVSGTAPGPWFFEASFPIKVIDANGNVIARTTGQAQGDWMTTGLVTFTATASTTVAYTGPATVVLLRDNPSGLPENDDSVSIPIVIQ